MTATTNPLAPRGLEMPDQSREEGREWQSGKVDQSGPAALALARLPTRLHTGGGHVETQGPLGRREGRRGILHGARADDTGRQVGAAEAAQAVPGDFHNAVHIGSCDANQMNAST